MLGVWFLSSIGPKALQVTLTLNFGGKGVVLDRIGLNISSIYGTTAIVTNCNVLPWPRWVLDRVGFFKSYIERFWVIKSFKMRKHGKIWENMGKREILRKKQFWIRRLNRTRSRHPHVCFLFKSTVCSYSFVLPHFVCRDFMLFKTIYSYDIIWYELHEIEIFDILWLIIPYAYAKLTNPQYKHGMVYVQIQIYVLTSIIYK